MTHGSACSTISAVMTPRLQRRLPFPRPRRRGRPPSGHAGVPHAPRPPLSASFPVHVTLKAKPHVATLRHRRPFGAIHRALVVACDRFAMRVVHFSVQRDHIHLLVEAKDQEALRRGMQGLAIRVAKGLNKVLGLAGKVFADRYHMRILRTPLEVKRVVAYIVNNAVRHGHGFGVRGGRPAVDPFSSAVYCRVFRTPVWKPPPTPGPQPVAAPRTWLLREGWWRRHGYLKPGEVGSQHLAAR